eukprot:c28583_g1_i5 orf=180-2012(-)
MRIRKRPLVPLSSVCVSPALAGTGLDSSIVVDAPGVGIESETLEAWRSYTGPEAQPNKLGGSQMRQPLDPDRGFVSKSRTVADGNAMLVLGDVENRLTTTGNQNGLLRSNDKTASRRGELSSCTGMILEPRDSCATRIRKLQKRDTFDDNPKLQEDEFSDRQAAAPSECISAHMSMKQILAVMAQAELSDDGEQLGLDNRGMDTNDACYTLSEHDGEGAKFYIQTAPVPSQIAQLQYEKDAGSDATNSKNLVKRPRTSRLHIPDGFYKASFKVHQKSRQSRRMGDLSCESHFKSSTSKETLSLVLYQMILEAGSNGLSSQEAVARLLSQGYLGLLKVDGSLRSVQVGRILRGNPLLTELDDGRFTLTTNVRANDSEQEDSRVKETHLGLDVLTQTSHDDHTNTTSRVEGLVESQSIINNNTDDKGQELHNPIDRKLESEKRCNRKDGRGWQCRRRCKPGVSYCEYHFVKVRANHERSATKLAARKTTTKKSSRSSSYNSGKNITHTSNYTERGLISSKTDTTNAKAKQKQQDTMIGEEEGVSDDESSAMSGELVWGGGYRRRRRRWRRQRKAVKARSLNSITKMMTMEGCVLNSDPQEWRSDLFIPSLSK